MRDRQVGIVITIVIPNRVEEMVVMVFKVRLLALGNGTQEAAVRAQEMEVVPELAAKVAAAKVVRLAVRVVSLPRITAVAAVARITISLEQVLLVIRAW